jgi:thiopurine S-methyltransferase
MRRAYAEHTDRLLAPSSFRLVVTLEYDQTLVNGPPFAVPADEVRAHWPDLELLDRREAHDEAPPKFRAAGVSLAESVWRSPAHA